VYLDRYIDKIVVSPVEQIDGLGDRAVGPSSAGYVVCLSLSTRW